MLKTALMTGFALMLAGVTFLPTTAQTPATVDFARDVQPLLRANCYSCHGPILQNGGYRLDRRRDSMPNRVGANGARIVPGNSASSRVYVRISSNQGGLQMPPDGSLTPEEIGIIKTWIDQGAEWPDEFSGETPSPPQDPQVTQLLNALRNGDRRAFERLLKSSPRLAQSRGSGGDTPLMYAALYGDAGSLRLLLDMGADPSVRNDAGATALLWSVDDPGKTRLLLERGADANARSSDGRTAVLLAASRFGGANVVRLLLGHGATLESQPVLSAAATAGDESLMHLLIDRGADRKTLPADLAMRSGCSACMALLLQSAERADLSRAIVPAARFGDLNAFKMLLERGAEASPAVLRIASASEKIPLDVVTTLLDRGIREDTALDLAMRHRYTTVAAALRQAGFKETSSTAATLKKPVTVRSPRAAVEKSLPLLQRADVAFLKAAGCVSCHNNSLFLMTAAAARRKGFRRALSRRRS